MDIRMFRTLAAKNRYALFASACLIPATCIQVAQAAEQPEEVIVTGSRIRQSPVERAAPVQTATSADIDRSGEISVADYLQRLPISGSAIGRSNNASGNLGFPPDGGGIGAGASEIDLRYLTSKRVLVLVDGKRWVRGSSASGVSGAVDLNTIPTAAIERIEVLQDGASPIYGSDAIAGVVNVITKSDFDGFEFETNQAAYDEGDGYTQDYNMSWGAKGERSHTFVSVGYARQDPVFSGDRELSRCVVFGATPCNFGGSGGVPQGRFIFVDPRGDVDGDGEDDVLDLTLNNGASGANYDPNNPASGDYHAFGAADRFNFRPFNYLTTPNRRINVFGKAAYDVSDKCRADVHGVVHEPPVAQPGSAEPAVHGLRRRLRQLHSRQHVHPGRPAVQPVRHRPRCQSGRRHAKPRHRRAPAARGRPAHLRPERRQLDAVGRTERRSAARRAHALLGRERELRAQQRFADGPQHLQRAQAGAGSRSPGRVRRRPRAACRSTSSADWAPSRRRCSTGRRTRRTT